MKCSNCNKLEIEIDKHKNCLKIKEATIDVQKRLIEDLRKDNLSLLAKLNKKYKEEKDELRT